MPSVAPTKLEIAPAKLGQLYVQWLPIPIEKFNGRALGYRVKYRVSKEPAYRVVTVPNGLSELTIPNIKHFTLYDFEVEAYSGAGSGLPIALMIKTPEGGIIFNILL